MGARAGVGGVKKHQSAPHMCRQQNLSIYDTIDAMRLVWEAAMAPVLTGAHLERNIVRNEERLQRRRDNQTNVTHGG